MKGEARIEGRSWLPILLAVGLLAAWSAAAVSQEEPAPQNPPPQEGAQAPGQAPPAGPAPAEPEVRPEAPQSAPAPEPQPPPSKPAPTPRKSRSRNRLTPEERLQDLEKRIGALVPRGTYILIDTGRNRLFLMKDGEVVREAICSTGSGRFLPDPPRGREWTFDTPKGEFRIQKKIVKPVWIKPDWAFIEDGEDLPKKSEEREAPDELGDFAMDLGDGYLIHGTLYERSLGMSVTHGCIRLGAKDLDAVFHAVKIGTPVYIY